ncbi:MAG TPA: ABC transporter permease [Clostridia bacterium]|nr:ABC transporter permease [Clostridia bacterium]HOS18748.1 ABC transporter permease [Clostridia bacterium]HPK15482.1 ABC transporter permease [Clostridia bacterium]
MEENVSKVRSFSTRREFYRQFRRKSYAQELWGRFVKNKTAVLGLAIFFVILMLAILAPLLADYNSVVIKLNVSERLQKPGAGHIFGTDELGRDIFARVIYGARNSLTISFISVAFALTLGGILGAISGYFGGVVDNGIMRVMDVFLCLPEILMALAFVAVFGTSIPNLIISAGLSFSPKFARIVRSAVLSVRGSEYLEAARSIGARDFYIIINHVIINCIGPIIVQVTLYIAHAILIISSLSFIGLGVQSPAPEWGNMLSSGREYMRDASYLVVSPGLAIFFTILSLNLLGDGLRDTLDPRLKQ